MAVFPVAASLLGALRDIITRRMAPTESTVAVLFVTTTLVMAAGWVSGLFTEWAPLRPEHYKYLIASGLLVGTAHFLLIESFRLGEASLVSPFKYANVLWAALFGYLLFGDLPGVMTLAGATVLAASGIYILHRERVSRAA